ncbi:MAG: apolipoprotein N-acyltransferase [Alphaproteobacteria bacterium]|nr:apolipoprotein N-acyltransferase [Alphaproteobacteria bacterium]
MNRLALALVGLTGWRRAGTAAALGAGAALALPPFHHVPLLIPAFTGFVWLLAACRTGRSAAITGWWFGFGHFTLAFYWTGNALLTDPERYAWALPFAVLGLPAVLAPFPALAAVAVHYVRGDTLARVLALAVAWTAAEWLRGHVLTGFPWNLIGYAWTPVTPLLQLTAVIGIYGLSALTIVAAASLACATDAGSRRFLPAGAALLGLAALTLIGVVRLAGDGGGEVAGVRLRIVQAAIAQHHKWLPETRLAQVERYVTLSSDAADIRPTHLIWPETATPFYLAQEPALLAALGRLVAPGGALLTGAPRLATGDPPQVWNSLHALDPGGRVVGTYDKHHLVPLGEYLPLRSVLARLGISKLTAGTIDFSAGGGPRTLAVPGLPPVSPLICYEAIFPDEVVAKGQRPAWLLNVTNDAWFSNSAGPYQHFAAARVRAIEQGLPLVRAANTGISAIVDPYGRIIGSLPLGHAGVLDGPLPRPTASPTPYARFGDAGALVLLVLFAVAAAERVRAAAAGFSTLVLGRRDLRY